MDAVEGNDSATERIVLAHEPPFRLGPLGVEPAMRRIAHGDGREEILEQRVMQVLVALVRAEGAILTRDDLIATCWDGRIVGDDAINRVMSRLRRTAEGLGRGIFHIETITKVGYRLMREGAEPVFIGASAGREPAPARRRRRVRRNVIIAAGLVTALILGLVLTWRWLGGGPGVPTVAVVTETRGGEAGALARDLSADLSRLAGARAADLAIVDSTRADEADYVVRIGGQRRGDRLEAALTLVDRASAELLWSARFERAAREQSDMREQIAVKLGDVLLCTLHNASADEARLDTVTLRLFLSFCDRIHDSFENGQLELIRQVTERAPWFARGWANLAVTEAGLGEIDQRRESRDDPARRARRAAALVHLRRARAMDPAIGETYLAEAFLVVGRARWAERLAIFDRGIAAAPYAPLYDYRAIDLVRVGRMSDAIQSARRAVALNPLSPWHRNALMSSLVYSGDVRGARATLEAAERIWPGSEAMRDMRFRFDLRYGDAANALRMLDDPVNAETTGPDDIRETFRIYLHARMNPSPGNIEAAIRAAMQLNLGSIGNASAYLQLLGYFGRVDEAYRLLDESSTLESWRAGTEILFRSQMRSIRNDRRFMPLALRLGLLQYWQSSGHWPDFCADQQLPYDCRAEARRLLAPPR